MLVHCCFNQKSFDKTKCVKGNEKKTNHKTRRSSWKFAYREAVIFNLAENQRPKGLSISFWLQ